MDCSFEIILLNVIGLHTCSYVLNNLILVELYWTILLPTSTSTHTMWTDKNGLLID